MHDLSQAKFSQNFWKFGEVELEMKSGCREGPYFYLP